MVNVVSPNQTMSIMGTTSKKPYAQQKLSVTGKPTLLTTFLAEERELAAVILAIACDRVELKSMEHNLGSRLLAWNHLSIHHLLDGKDLLQTLLHYVVRRGRAGRNTNPESSGGHETL